MGHSSETLYQPVVRIPLLIWDPGRQAGVDVHTATSAVDLVPTLAQVTGHAVPAWSEGAFLPPFAAEEASAGRSIYRGEGDAKCTLSALTKASTMLLRDRHKLAYYFGFGDLGIPDIVKLYDVQSDPEELTDLSSSEKAVTEALLRELKSKLDVVNGPYL